MAGNPTLVQVEEKPIANIVRVDITTEEAEPKRYSITTADEGTYTPVVSEGSENILRTKNTIHAIDSKEDIQYGSDIKLKDLLFTPEVLAIIDGGTIKTSTVETVTKVTGYEGPVVGQPVKRKKFTLDIYTEEKDTSTETVGYQKFSFPGCKGTPVEFSFKDGEYMSPEYTVKSRPGKGKAPFDLDFLEQLPE